MISPTLRIVLCLLAERKFKIFALALMRLGRLFAEADDAQGEHIRAASHTFRYFAFPTFWR
jgi:hypothetical protein